jgi:hypothetical protein
MEREEFLITTSVDGHEWPFLWNAEGDMGLDHPERWRISRTEAGFLFIHVNGKRMRLREDRIGPDDYVELPCERGDPRRILVNVQKLKPIRPAFLPVSLPSQLQFGMSRIYASAGIRDYLVGFEEVSGNYKAMLDKEPVFQFAGAPNGISQIIALRPNVRFKMFGGKSKPIPLGTPVSMKTVDFSRAAILWGGYWWRFNQVPTPQMLPPDEYEEEEAEIDARSFKKLGKIVAVILVLALLDVKFLMRFPAEKKQETKQVEVALKRPKTLEGEKKPPPKPTPKPTQVAKVEPPKPKPPEPKPKPKPPEKKLVQKPKPKPPEKKLVLKPQPKPPPQKFVPTTQVAKPTKPQIGIPTAKTNPAPQGKGVLAVPTKPDPTAQARAVLTKSLGFLSTGPSKAANPLTTIPGEKFTNRYKNMGAAALSSETKRAGATILSNLAANTAAIGGPIATTGARNISSSLSLGGGGGKGKALNEVLGRVSIPQLYSGDAGEGIAGALTGGGKGGISVSGAGKMSEALIEKILSRHLAKFQYCYEKALLSEPSLAWNILFQWVIAPGGQVSNVKVVRSAMNNAGLHRCITAEIGRISFAPGPTGGSVEVRHPFAFSASSL